MIEPSKALDAVERLQPQVWKDFKAFLIKQNAIALAIGVVIGQALNSVVDSIVKGIIMPIAGAITPNPARYQELPLDIWRFHFKPGLILNAVINFFIIGFVAWRMSKLFIRDKPTAKPATKTCPFCRMNDLDTQATRCPHCTSQLEGATA